MFRKTLRIIIILAVIAILSIQTSSTLAQQDSFTETFDDPALDDWIISDNVFGLDGALVIEGEGFAFHHGDWTDRLISFRFQWSGPGAVAAHYQAGDPGSYLVHLGREGVALLMDEEQEVTEIAFAQANIQEGEWHQLIIKKTGESHLIYLNNELVLNEIIPDVIPAGGIVLRSEGDVLASFDDLSVEAGSEQSPVEESPLAQEAQEETEEEPQEETPTNLSLSELYWVHLGGPPGGLGYDIRYKFDDPNIWYVTDASSGVHISYDNGFTWQQSNDGIDTIGGPAGDGVPIFCLTVDPHNPDIIWAGTDGTGRIYKSLDGGQTWTSKDRGVIREHEVFISFRGFTVDPRSSDIVYAMAELARPGNNVWGLRVGGVIYKTTDGGEHWTRLWNGGIPSSLARYMWINPQNPDVLYVSTGIFDRGAVGETDPETNPDPFGGLGVLKSTDGGKTWQVLGKENGLESLYIGSLYMHPENPEILYAAAGHLITDQIHQQMVKNGHSPAGIYRTTDGGENWEQILEPESGNYWQTFTAVEICPSDFNIIYAGSERGIYRSDDGGDNWRRTTGGVHGWGSEDAGAGWPIDLQCDPRDPDRIFANNYGGGNFLSEDGGKNFVNASTGYSGAQIISIAVDPFAPARVYVAGRSGPWYSIDGGTTWKGIVTNLPVGGSGVAVDHIRKDHIILGGEFFAEWVSSENQWVPRDLPYGYYFETSVIEFAPSDSKVVYAVSANHNSMIHADHYELGKGIAVSRDGGENWTSITGEEFADVPLTDISINPTEANIAYVASQIGLFKTLDGGENWISLTNLSQGKPVRTVGVSPQNPNKVFAGIPYQGLFVSEDGGENWKMVAAGLEPNAEHRDMVFDPTNPDIIYLADIVSGVYQSVDGGESWIKIIEGLTNRGVMSLAISSDGNHLYAATSGAGVYRLDLNGQPPEPIYAGLEVDQTEEVTPQDEPAEQVKPDQQTETDDPPDESKFNLPCAGGLAPLAFAGYGLVIQRKKKENSKYIRTAHLP